MAGVALLFQYIVGMNLWLGFSLINVPFYLLGLRQFGWTFVLRTFLAVTSVSLFAHLTAEWIDFSELNAVYAAVMASVLCGTGMLMLFRHRTGLGDINILAIFLQESYGIRAGYVQLFTDLAILCVAFLVLTPDRMLLSILSTIILNMILAINHRPGRYLGVS